MIIAVVGFYELRLYQKSQLKSRIGNEESKLPKNGDPCEGTGGKGQIISMGNNSVFIKLNDNGSNQTINLTSQTIVRVSTGSGSISDLKKGENISIGGKRNADGSLTANIIAVCKVTKK